MVFLEAWSFAKPVIGGDIPVLREMINHGWDGYLVKQEPSQIAQRLVDLLSSKNLCQTMGHRGRQKVVEKYSWDVLAEKTEAAYQYALSRK